MLTWAQLQELIKPHDLWLEDVYVRARSRNLIEPVDYYDEEKHRYLMGFRRVDRLAE